ncbi:hypothetical protein BH09BAC3_BH09BAC3_36080 [soil metagenome]
MELFILPNTAKVNRVIPKNAFDSYTTTKQKKLFTDLIAKITWTHKLSPDTINLESKDIKEIQIFRIELKLKEEIQSVLEVIDKSIPYHIVFIVEHKGRIYLSTSAKHAHPTKEDNAVIDWTFKTNWFLPTENKYELKLKKNIDAVFHDFCVQLSGNTDMSIKPLKDLIEYKRHIDTLEKEIQKLKMSIASGKQFNYKVELNMRLKEAENELRSLVSKPLTQIE